MSMLFLYQERELSVQSLESGIIFHKFNKQVHTQKLKKKKEVMKAIFQILQHLLFS